MPLTPNQIELEGHTLAMYLLCVNAHNMADLSQPSARTFANRPAAFTNIPQPVYDTVRSLVLGINPGTFDHQGRLSAFQQSFAEAARRTMSLDDNQYPPPDDSCFSSGTGSNLQNPGLIAQQAPAQAQPQDAPKQ
jgi:hypothetical protein